MILYIYDVKTLNIVAKPIVNSNNEFTNNPLNFYPDWNMGIHIVSEIEFQNPMLDINIIREKTREELILLDNKNELLQDGEYVENNKIIRVEAPSYLFKKLWNKENNLWEEGGTQEDINLEVNKLIDEFTILGEQKERWIKYGFDVLDIENKIAENIIRRKFLLEIF
ncbi:hypothetical protein H3N56_03880 [Cetobacterium sp. 2A]|uniref:hypothetical protein n=1 Tax=Cetobacterium sp. 2A TaxID=2754723 RepID=UPI00163B83C7|nr:hypothetical protein [Cetobacterium sp. 2A]MBC2855228.1 hypothetical protein [Cetobacterium sp. 2A]MBC2855277.1 hypothetical protein [Cetobacterium sp. 2A]MBC2855637.1 hypothetical protein [Cetobacterium sp. 2A]